MKKCDPTVVSELIATKYARLEEIVQHIANAISRNKEETGRLLHLYGLETLRPMTVLYPPSGTLVEDNSDKVLIDAITSKLGALPLSDISEEAQHYGIYRDFLWEKPLLVNWCRRHKLPVPEEWQQWMQTTYPELQECGLVDEGAQTPATTQTIVGPSTARREVRKLETAKRHEAWRREARRIRQKHRAAKEWWIAEQISQMDIAEDRSVETIRRVIRE